jgi:dienelactone hydrolase
VIALQPLDYRHDAVALRGQLAVPAGEGPHPGVLVMSEARGLGEQARRRAAMLAEQGYVALCTDVYGDGVRYEDPQESGPPLYALRKRPKLLRERVLAGFEALRARPEVDARRIGAIGFCFGGQCVLELARSGADVKAVVSFHGSLLTTKLPAKPGAVRARVLALTGARDPYAPRKDVDRLRKELTAAGADWQITVYGEGYHSFTDPSADGLTTVPGVRYDPLLDRLSWASALAMLEASLR